MKKLPVALGLVLVLVGTIAVLTHATRESEYWNWLTLKTVERSDRFNTQDGNWRIHGLVQMKRWTSRPVTHGRSMWYYDHSGRVFSSAMYEDGSPLTYTHWNPDGTVSYQRDNSQPDGENSYTVKLAPPWWWGAADL